MVLTTDQRDGILEAMSARRAMLDAKVRDLAAKARAEPPPPAPAAPPALLVVRPTRPDGRLIPQEGDKVFQAVAGPFGMPASIHGEVRKGRVHITGTSAMIGGGTSRKTDALTEHWTVVNDPELQRRRDAREAAEQAKRDARAAEQAADEARRVELAAARGTLDPATVTAGSVVEDAEGVPHFIAQVHGGGLYGYPLDGSRDTHAGGLGPDYRGWRATGAAPPVGRSASMATSTA
jgi:hypothetical protein